MSDIITNSSSEVFCRITSQNELEQIYNFLKRIFPGDEYEIDTVVEIRNLDDEMDILYDEDIKELSPHKQHIAIEVPYHLEDLGSLIKIGLPTILKEKFPSEDFTVIFD